MQRGSRKLNKYEKAYLKSILRSEKKKRSLGKKIVISFYVIRKKILRFLKTKSINIREQKNILFSQIKENQQKRREKREKKNEEKIRRGEKKEEQKPLEIIEPEREKIDIMKKDIKKVKVHKKKKGVKKELKPHKKSKKPKKRKKRVWSWLKGIIVFFVILTLIGLGVLFVWFSSLEIPSVDNFDKRKISNSTKLYDKTGEILLYDIHENIQRTVVSGDKISQYAKDAIIAIEDHNFYEHNGVVWKSTIRAVIQTLLSKIGFSTSGPAGGSTLTQQVIKNTLLTREKTIQRKMKEWVLAYKLEKKMTKDEILTTYLNEAPYGGTIYGIQEASRVFFGKTADDLTIAEAAYLASIPNLPTFYSPYGSHKEELKKRQRVVLSEMRKYNYISDSEYRKALEEKVEFLPQEENYAKALHFVQYVRSLLEEKYGADMVENGGLKVITTLDYKLQQKAEKIIKEHVENVKDQDATNAALVAIEAETGNIITMVGSRDYFDTENFDGNFNVALSPRQPGSSFKPFAYATAFEKGYLPETIIFDTQTQFNSNCDEDDFTSEDGCYSPNNYDYKFKGPLSFRNALAQSRNIPAVKISYLAGVSDIIEKAHEMGITSLNKKPSYYGLGLVLGGGEVSLLDMVSAYTTFANDGRHHKVNAILEVSTIEGEVLEKFEEERGERVFSKNVARMISSILSDNEARTPLFGSHSVLYFGKRDVAGKTGTTNDKRDAWMLGYTTDVAVGVWTGNNDNSPMKKGSILSTKPWRLFMDEIIDTYGSGHFKDYDLPDNFDQLPNMLKGEWFGGETYVIDTVSGKLATEYTPEETKKEIIKFEPHTILHFINKSHPQEPGNSRNDPQYKNWEYGVQRYIREEYADKFDPDFEIPTEYDDVHTENGIVQEGDFDFDIEIDSYYDFDETIKVEIDLDGIRKDEVAEVLFYVNNSFIGSINSRPFVFSFFPEDIPYLKEKNTLRVVVVDMDGKKVSREEKFKVKNIPEDFHGEEVEVEILNQPGE